jgi:hypothetical protein
VKHPVELERQVLESLERFDVGALNREDRNANLDRHSLVADLSPLGKQVSRGRRSWWLGIGNERSSASPTDRVEMPALTERYQRLAESRARDPEPPAQFALGG